MQNTVNDVFGATAEICLLTNARRVLSILALSRALPRRARALPRHEANPRECRRPAAQQDRTEPRHGSICFNL